MRTDEMSLREAGEPAPGVAEKLPEDCDAVEANGQSEIARKFLQVSAAYIFGCAYCASLRAAYVKSSARNPVSEYALRYRELIAREASVLMRTRFEEEATAFAATAPPVCNEIVTRGA